MFMFEGRKIQLPSSLGPGLDSTPAITSSIPINTTVPIDLSERVKSIPISIVDTFSPHPCPNVPILPRYVSMSTPIFQVKSRRSDSTNSFSKCSVSNKI